MLLGSFLSWYTSEMSNEGKLDEGWTTAAAK